MGLLPWLLVTVVIFIHGGGTARATADRVGHARIVEETEERTERTEMRVRRSSSSSFGPKHLSTKRQCADSGFRGTFTAAVADALGIPQEDRSTIVLREYHTDTLNGLAKSFELRSGGEAAGRVVDADEALRHVLLRCVDEPSTVVCRDRDASDSTTPKPKTPPKAKKDKDSSSSSSSAACPEGEESSGGGSFDRVEELAVAVIAAISLAGNLWGAAKAFCAKNCAGGAYQAVAAASEREAVASGGGKALTPAERAAVARAEANNNGNSGSSYYSSPIVAQTGQYPGGEATALPASSQHHQAQQQQFQQQFQQPQAVFVVAGEPQQQPQHQPAALNASGASSSSSVAAAAALSQPLPRVPQRQPAPAASVAYQPLLVVAPPAARINSTAFFSPSASAPSPSLSTILSPNPTNPANLYPTIHSNPSNPYYHPNLTNTTNPTSNPFVDGGASGGDYTTDSGFGQY